MKQLLLGLTLMAVSVGVVAAPTIPEVSSVNSLLIRAIDTDQEVAAWLVGDVAEKIRQQTKAPAGTKVMAKVSTVHVIREGCKRLHLEFSEPSHKMKTNKGTEEPFVMWYDMNICRDGKPPQLSTIGLTGEK